jgi:hypothetical protein
MSIIWLHLLVTLKIVTFKLTLPLFRLFAYWGAAESGVNKYKVSNTARNSKYLSLEEL